MNREEALRCFNIAKGYFHNDDYEQVISYTRSLEKSHIIFCQALKFFNKSFHLEKSDLTLQYITTCEDKIRQGFSSSQKNSSSASHRREEHHSSSPNGKTSQANEHAVNRYLRKLDFLCG